MDIKFQLYRANYLLNHNKLKILEVISKSYSHDIVMKIVHENSFLLNSNPILDSSLIKCDHLQLSTLKVIGEIVYRRWKEYRSADCTLMPLDMVTKHLQNEDLYNAVYLLITCGAVVDVRNVEGKSPINALCGRNEQKMVMKTLRFMLKRGRRANSALRHENKFSILNIAISSAQRLSNKFRVAKMLLEFGAVPRKNTLCLILSEKTLLKDMDDMMKLVKLIMQYLLIYYFKLNSFKINKLVSSEEYDKILDLSTFSNSACFTEMIELRYKLIKEITAMIHERINTITLFAFIFKRCTNGLAYHKNEESLLYKVIAILHSNRYNCCDVLLRASIKRAAVLPVLCSLCIYAKKPSGKKVALNSDVVSNLAYFLSRKDIINLILAFWTEPVIEEEIPAKRCLRKRTRDCLSERIDQDMSSFVNSFSIPVKYRKLNK